MSSDVAQTSTNSGKRRFSKEEEDEEEDDEEEDEEEDEDERRVLDDMTAAHATHTHTYTQKAYMQT